MMGYFYWTSVASIALALVLGRKDSEGIYMPHPGYTWSAVMLLLVWHGVST